MNPHGSGYGGNVHRGGAGASVRQSGFRRGLGGRGRVVHGVGGVWRPAVRRGDGGVHTGVSRPVVCGGGGGGEGSGGSVIGDLGGGSGPGRAQQQVSVWWDIDNCNIPHDVDSRTISCKILCALQQIGYIGKASIFAYGNSRKVNLSQQNALNSNGVNFIHVPPGNDATDRKMMVDMMIWAFDNPSPAGYLIISGDTDFWPTMKTLKTKGYTIMMAGHPHTYTYTIPATTIWDWSILASGGLPLVDHS